MDSKRSATRPSHKNMEPHIPIDMDKIKAFCEKWKVEEFSLFGSVLRDDFSPDSDVDVLVKISDYSGIGLYEWMDMIEEMEAIFGRKVDLVEAAALRNPYRRREIIRTKQVIYAR
ncbi:MAG: nucleotidyltransferase domain-containing protein [Candidatus Omnitrophota bacterium]